MPITHPGVTHHHHKKKGGSPPVKLAYWKLPHGVDVPIGFDIPGLDSLGQNIKHADPIKGAGQLTGTIAGQAGKGVVGGVTDFVQGVGDTLARYVHKNIWVVLVAVIMVLVLVSAAMRLVKGQEG